MGSANQKWDAEWGGAGKGHEEEIHVHPVGHHPDVEGMVPDPGESSDQEGTGVLGRPVPQESGREEISNVLGCRMDQKETQLGDGQVLSIRGNGIVMYNPC